MKKLLLITLLSILPLSACSKTVDYLVDEYTILPDCGEDGNNCSPPPQQQSAYKRGNSNYVKRTQSSRKSFRVAPQSRVFKK